MNNQYGSNKLFEGSLLASLDINLFGTQKSRKKYTIDLADRENIDRKRLRVSVNLIPERRYTRIRKARRAADFTLAKHGVPWSAQVNNRNGGVENNGQWLILARNVYDFEKDISQHRMTFEQACKEDVFDLWPDIVTQGVHALKLDDDEIPTFYPSLDIVKSRFSWNLNIQPLWDVRDIQNDVRLKASSDFIDDAMGNAIASQNKKISHVVKSLVDEVVDVVSEQSDRLSSYSHGEKGPHNSIPKAPTWEKTLPRLADKLESWAPMLADSTGDNALSGAASEIRQLVSHVKGISDGDLRKAHKVLSQEDSGLRKDVRDKLDKITTTASSALEDFLS